MVVVRVVGVDFNAGACRCAKANGIEALRGNAFALPLAAGVADLVLNVEFAQEHEPEMVATLLRGIPARGARDPSVRAAAGYNPTK